MKFACQESCYLKSWNQGCKQVVNRMPALPTWREVGSASGKMVLFDFTRRACLVIIQSQLVLLSRSSEIHVCMIKTVVCIWSEGQGWSSCMSSGKDWLETEWISINEQRGVEYRMKRIGPRTKPSATPIKNPQVLNSGHWQSQSKSYQWGKTQTMKEWCQKCHRLKSVEENMVVLADIIKSRRQTKIHHHHPEQAEFH